ncbi:MAG: Rossman fold protein, TIGR00730 family [Candidatus Zambryskibacteria bacterium RIFCSPLOWO2_01_FULL_39_39]|uniref:Cytokinin riboside 5'-monophosphate phosphoribohydrolase n=1 Tax=Candidatus Zambryskibacteria bacterium RIFCSPLOWO2_01_FULL_39_39 TaxID=1802758 RepID=A0A1G2TW88_9BACT|nr:MAG: Lysine decarboxylase family protein [Parcubacteria group bacterium GW2011_GWA1_38_7]OHA86598.1 MAG: Rossman fold protein, TIGR00730 family [Candidatus Zambryskibacteria bacterium RIFCSPHIGHO2_01_FULL_39_63]OHA94233.1 MAG: Rossman fold protein, TIGR00730 family [Candidatus Zambryskibacteria bacterium RIFCSPHIGHO2_02_FULL_39_19]OHA98500.1 MAG: Rossman fold protein, TIGR00730 family [Candidatus Zambryskibacteria bacterium RIFCSPHIGHO2_12_FULL_39_21]OHB01419.1 MAG: Rossman fold protein, TIG
MDNNIKPLTLLEISEAARRRVTFISKEFENGFEFIKNYPRSVTFFGSARIKEDDLYYKKAEGLASRIVKELHYSVTTGGGPGIMEAANRGAFEAGGNSLGLTIDLPHEQLTNQYLTDKEDFHYFFSRKVCLAFSAEAYIFFPGGFGTLDEFLEILTLVQTNKIPKAPIILIGTSFWNHLELFFREVLLQNMSIEENDLSLYTITDNEDEILEIIKRAPIRMGLKYDENLEKVKTSDSSQNDHGPLSGLFKKISW